MDNLIVQLITGTAIGLGAGYLGAFMVLRRMSLVGDALSHVALPGIAAALLFSLDPFIGAFAALLTAILIIWFLETRTTLPSETLVGILFTISLAVGLLLTPEPELLEALFGDISRIGTVHMLVSLLLVMIVCATTYVMSRSIILGIISKDLALAMRIPIDRINLFFLLLVAVIVALGLKVAGTLLMGSLVIIPAAAAQNISPNMTRYTGWAAFLGAVSAFSGIFIATQIDLTPGPVVVLVSGLIFLATLLIKRAK